jgi:hypothetical protein
MVIGTFNRISGASAGALRRPPQPQTAALRCAFFLFWFLNIITCTQYIFLEING